VTQRDRKWPEVTSLERKSPGSGCGRPVSRGLGAFELLQGCNSQEVAVTWQEMTSRDRKWHGNGVILPEVTWGGCRRPGSQVLGKFELLLSYEAFHHSTSPFHYSIPLFHSTIPFHHSLPLNVDTWCCLKVNKQPSPHVMSPVVETIFICDMTILCTCDKSSLHKVMWPNWEIWLVEGQ